MTRQELMVALRAKAETDEIGTPFCEGANEFGDRTYRVTVRNRVLDKISYHHYRFVVLKEDTAEEEAFAFEDEESSDAAE